MTLRWQKCSNSSWTTVDSDYNRNRNGSDAVGKQVSLTILLLPISHHHNHPQTHHGPTRVHDCKELWTAFLWLGQSVAMLYLHPHTCITPVVVWLCTVCDHLIQQLQYGWCGSKSGECNHKMISLKASMNVCVMFTVLYNRCIFHIVVW